jgi:exopolyphosphatase / guanosine-5'-triphosphate,3'-diphosphate pyrophosphatase
VRVAVVDIGSNSTRLLIADVGDGSLEEVERRSIVTRLGEGVDATGALGDAPQARVFAVLDDYTAAIDAAGCERRSAVLTSAVRDAGNGPGFTAAVRERYGLDAHTLTGDEEAQLTFRGATAGRGDDDGGAPLLVVDIGGGSTELVVGTGGEVGFHVSTQAGVVRHTERHLPSDPPTPAELAALTADARGVLAAAVPGAVRAQIGQAVAVAGTATYAAAIDIGSADGAGIEGHVLTRDALEAQLARLAALPLTRRREVVGLHPDRAPTMVAGVALLLCVLDVFGLERIEVSERDILWGVALTPPRA